MINGSRALGTPGGGPNRRPDANDNYGFVYHLVVSLSPVLFDCIVRSTGQQGLSQVAQVRSWGGFLEPEMLGLLVWAAEGAEEDVHERAKVGVVAGVAVPVVVPVV